MEFRNSSLIGESGLYTSTDGGATFSLSFSGGHIGTLAISPSNTRVAYCTLSTFANILGLYQTTDGGASWNNVLSGSNPLNSLVQYMSVFDFP